MTNRIKELAKKLLTLASDGRGNANEEDNAQRVLESFMEKHGLTMADLEADVENDYYFAVYSDFEQRFFNQIYFSVMGDDGEGKCKALSLAAREIKELKLKPNAIVMEYKCAKHEHALILDRMAFYWKHWQEEMNVFYSAFVQKNAIYGDPSRVKKNNAPPSKEDFTKIMAMMNTIDKKTMSIKLESNC